MKSQFHQIILTAEACAIFAFEWPEVSFLTGGKDGTYVVVVGGNGGKHRFIGGGRRVDKAVDEY